MKAKIDLKLQKGIRLIFLTGDVEIKFLLHNLSNPLLKQKHVNRLIIKNIKNSLKSTGLKGTIILDGEKIII